MFTCTPLNIRKTAELTAVRAACANIDLSWNATLAVA